MNLNAQQMRSRLAKAISAGLVCVLAALSSTQSLSAPEWISTAPVSPLLPRADFRMSACISPTTPDIINLLGGKETPKAWAQFNITSETFIDRGNVTFNPGTKTTSAPQNTQQIGSMFYFLDNYENPYLNQVDIDQLPAEATRVSNTRVNYGGSKHGCLVAADNKLFVIGGNMVPDAAIFDLSSNVWSSAPSLNTARRGHACVHHPTRDELYAIGGYTYSAGSVGLTSIERISVTGISSQSWSFLRNELIYRALFMTAIYDERDDSILVVGGATSPIGSTALAAIQVISCESGIVSIAASMSYAVLSPAVIMVPSTRVIYVFGGSTERSSGPATNQWQYIDISDTQSPTAPSVPPTTHPSVSPTAPSDAPSNHPSSSPIATLHPSGSPTGHPMTSQPTEQRPVVGTDDTVNDHDTMAQQNVSIWAVVIAMAALILAFSVLMAAMYRNRAPSAEQYKIAEHKKQLNNKAEGVELQLEEIEMKEMKSAEMAAELEIEENPEIEWREIAVITGNGIQQ